jgi:hypothetical protein
VNITLLGLFFILASYSNKRTQNIAAQDFWLIDSAWSDVISGGAPYKPSRLSARTKSPNRKDGKEDQVRGFWELWVSGSTVCGFDLLFCRPADTHGLDRFGASCALHKQLKKGHL